MIDATEPTEVVPLSVSRAGMLTDGVPTSAARLNEVMPVPAQDGIVDEIDEWVELYNAGAGPVDLSGWFLDDGPGGSEPYRMPEGTAIRAGGFLLLHGRTTGVVLDDAGDQIRLLDAAGDVVDAVAFGQLLPNASYSRDEFGVWHDDWPPSPGSPNGPSGAPSVAETGTLNLRSPGTTQPSATPARIGGPIP